jgi:hypothetical protein
MIAVGAAAGILLAKGIIAFYKAHEGPIAVAVYLLLTTMAVVWLGWLMRADS